MMITSYFSAMAMSSRDVSLILAKFVFRGWLQTGGKRSSREAYGIREGDQGRPRPLEQTDPDREEKIVCKILREKSNTVTK